MKVSLTSDFGKALCQHYGLDPELVLQPINIVTEVDEIFSAVITICLTADDLIGIGQEMKKMQ